MNAGFVEHPGIVQAVTIHCQKAKPTRRGEYAPRKKTSRSAGI